MVTCNHGVLTWATSAVVDPATAARKSGVKASTILKSVLVDLAMAKTRNPLEANPRARACLAPPSEALLIKCQWLAQNEL
jgi:hypothetical protein